MAATINKRGSFAKFGSFLGDPHEPSFYLPRVLFLTRGTNYVSSDGHKYYIKKYIYLILEETNIHTQYVKKAKFYILEVDISNAHVYG